MRSTCFAPIAEKNARILILGTLPSQRSLECGEYYANPRNQFWWIMGQLVGTEPELPYSDRIHHLKLSKVALWDVCQSAERPGSLDAQIRSSTPNDFNAFFVNFPQIQFICFNGRKAEKIFTQKVSGSFKSPSAIAFETLDSTSPANTHKRNLKLDKWRNCLTRAGIIDRI
jgi:hypoxanthine-DNA glycosylase